MSEETRWFLYQVFLRPNIMVTVYNQSPEDAIEEAIDHVVDYTEEGQIIPDVVSKYPVDFKPKVLAVCEVMPEDICRWESDD